MVVRLKRRYIALVVAVVMIAAITKAGWMLSDAAEDKYSFPIIMYHNICEDRSRLNDYCILPSQFKSDMEYILSKGYTTITVENLLDFEGNGTPLPEKAIMITFDDGQESFYKYAYPVLKEYNMTAVMSIVGTFTDKFSSIDEHNVVYSYMTWSEVSEVWNSGFVEIGNHTYNMHSFEKSVRKGCKIKKGENADVYKKLLFSDVDTFQKEITEKTSKTPQVFAYPYGLTCNEADAAVKEMGFKVAFTCDGKNVVPKSSEDWLFHLGRYNRPYKKSTYQFFAKILKN